MLRRTSFALLVGAAFIAGSVLARPIPVRSTPTAGIGPCETDGVAVSFTTAFMQTPPPAGTRVTSVDVGDIAPACAGSDLAVTLLDDTTSIAGGGAVAIGGTTENVAMIPAPLAEEVVRIHVEIAGIPVAEPTPPPTGGGGDLPDVGPRPSPTTTPLPVVKRGRCTGLAHRSVTMKRAPLTSDLIIVGSAAVDILAGTDGDDTLCGLAGDDQISGLAGDDWLGGGPGADRLRGGAGADVVNGGVRGDDLGGGYGNDTVRGRRGDDRLRGGRGTDLIAGGLGNDAVAGGAGHDLMRGGADDDILVGGPGRDILNGGAGFDVCYVDERDRAYNCERVLHVEEGSR